MILCNRELQRQHGARFSEAPVEVVRNGKRPFNFYFHSVAHTPQCFISFASIICTRFTEHLDRTKTQSRIHQVRAPRNFVWATKGLDIPVYKTEVGEYYTLESIADALLRSPPLSMFFLPRHYQKQFAESIEFCDMCH